MTMPSSPFKRLYADLKIDIPGLTDAVLQQVFFRVWKDFCDKTNIWTEECPISATPNVLSYPFTVTKKGTPNRLLLVYDPAQKDPDKKWVQGNIAMQVPGIITISYSPSTATTWNVVVAKTPLDPVNSEGYPDLLPADYWIVDKYRDALTYGTLGMLQNSPAKTYTNPKLAAYNRQQYISERSKARGDVQKANTFGGQRWMFPQNFATTGRKGWS
jgi:hypothetical protein